MSRMKGIQPLSPQQRLGKASRILSARPLFTFPVEVLRVYDYMLLILCFVFLPACLGDMKRGVCIGQ